MGDVVCGDGVGDGDGGWGGVVGGDVRDGARGGDARSRRDGWVRCVVCGLLCVVG